MPTDTGLISALKSAISALKDKLATVDPTSGFTGPNGQWINRAAQLQAEIAAKEAQLAGLEAQLAAEAGAGATEAAGAGAAGGSGVVSRVLTGIGRGVLRIIGRKAVEGSALALGTGVVVTTVVLGVATYAAANFVGSHSGDPSVQGGARLSQPASTAVTGPQSSGSDKVAVFLLPDNSGGTIWIGQESSLKTLRTCDLPNGGLCDDPNKTYSLVRYVKESQDFNTEDEATADLCKAGPLEPGYWGQKIAAYGGHYWYAGACP